MAYYEHHPILTEIYVLLVGVASTALLVSIFHCIRIRWLNRQRRASEQLRQTTVLEQGDTPSGFENSMVELMPARKYQKGMGLGGEDGVCPVCLSEFEDGEELRTLPECMHSYHVTCIDMWLLSHPNCPMCRADATPSIATQIVIDSGVAFAALIIIVYHCISVNYRNQQRRRWQQQQQIMRIDRLQDMPSDIENSMVELIPAHKYQRSMGLEGEDGVCPVCLCEFEEGEELRTLPECMHTFHVACIDMWLYSHPNCPMCRAETTPSPRIPPALAFSVAGPTTREDSSLPEALVVQ
ncbi:hypothetical protein RJ640_009288 [Escallonia rubra]|uniref:RING-type domain-containing protein n=1 Tax=Escallonia rubra TaxID=112253 RepID=A0AA88RDG2_9ASTE|nr:hypothetical protein RJ640_009288 [Escallonia rubra]